jgi:hypothetical protein
MSAAERAAAHAAEAEKRLGQKPTKVDIWTKELVQANAHATLALYFQREAEQGR